SSGAHIHQHGGTRGNSIDAFPARDQANVVGGLGMVGHGEPGECMNRTPHGMNGAWRAEGTPARAAWPLKSDFQACTANPSNAGFIQPVAFYSNDGIHLTLPGFQEGADTAQISQPFFANTGRTNHAPWPPP